MSSLQLLVCALLVSISAFMSGSEVALFSLSRFQIRSMKERSVALHRRIKRLLSDPGGLLITILFINEIVNISLSTLITEAVSESWDDSIFSGLFHWLKGTGLDLPDWFVQSIAGTFITVPIVLLFCDITPKVFATRANQPIASLVSGPLGWIYDALRPVRWLLKLIVNAFTRGITRITRTGSQNPATEKGDVPLLREEEFLTMVEEGHKEGAVHESEKELIHSVFELDDTRVIDVFTPLSKVQALPEETTIEAALASLKTKRYSRIPIYKSNRRHITGILYAKDLLLAQVSPDLSPSTPVSKLMRKPLVANPSAKLNNLFRRLKQHQTHIAVVEGRPGEAAGIITMSDVLDELFEDFLSGGEELIGEEG